MATCFKKIDLAYIGGIIDGEGGVYFYHYAYTPNYPLIRVSMTDTEAVNLLNSLFPSGKVKKEYRVNKYTASGTRRKTQWYWQVAYRKACAFAKVILPYVKIKSKRNTLKQIIAYYERKK